VKVCPSSVIAKAGLGKFYVETGNIEKAVKIYSKVLTAKATGDPLHIQQCYEHRAEAYLKLENTEAALSDLDQVFLLNPNPHDNLWTKRGKLLQAMKFYERSNRDFLEALNRNGSVLSHYNYGFSSTFIGDFEMAIREYEIVLNLDPVGMSSMLLHLARCYSNLGRWNTSLGYIEQAKNFAELKYHVKYFQAELLEKLGFMQLALNNFQQVIGDGEVSKMYDVKPDILKCYVALGLFIPAIELITRMIEETAKKGQLWYHREVLIFWLLHYRAPHSSFNLNNDVEAYVRAGWNGGQFHEDFRYVLQMKQYRSLYERHSNDLLSYRPTGDPDSISPDTVLSAEGVRLLQLTAKLGSYIHLNVRGFMPNVRLQRAFGLSVLEAAQLIRRHARQVYEGRAGGGGGVRVTNAGSSRDWDSYDSKDSCVADGTITESGVCGARTGTHVLGYRDVADVLVRWRQLASITDGAFWFDRMPQFPGSYYPLTTYILAGSFKNTRYYSYYDQFLQLIRDKLIRMNGYYVGEYVGEGSRYVPLSKDQKRAVERAGNVSDLHQIVARDFYLVVEVQSSVDHSLKLKGSSLFVRKASPEGYDVGVETPHDLDRVAQYDRELEWLFGEAVELLGVHLSVEAMGESRETRAARFDKIVDLSLRLFYYWVSLCPLTRGSAHTGYALMAAVVVATGRPRNAGRAGRTSGGRRRIGIEGEQLDWEALLSESPDAFVKHKREAWIDRLDVSGLTDDVLDVSDRALDVGIVFSTPAKVIGALANITERGNVSEEVSFLNAF